jgi:hypothetical protein
MPRRPSPATRRSPGTEAAGRRRPGRAILLALLLWLLPTLWPATARQALAQQPAGDAEEEQSLISLAELHEMTSGFADRYMTYIVSAVEKIEKNNPNDQQRRLAHRIKLIHVSAVYDIVTNPDPFTQLLDLTLVVSLQARKWIDDNLAESWFGPRGRFLVASIRQAREDIWKIASRVMRSSQLEQLDTMILQWHRKHPDIEMVSYVRFDDFAASRSKSIVAEVAQGGGFLAPVGEATKAVDEVRLLGERAFYLGKRMPFLLSWQAREAISDVLGSPDLARITAAVPQITASVDRATRIAERLPADIRKEREAIDALFDKHMPLVDKSLHATRDIVQDSTTLATEATTLAGSVESLLARLVATSVTLRYTVGAIDEAFIKPGRDKPPDPNAKPFDIAEYAKTAEAFTGTLQRASTLLADVKTTLDSPQLVAALNGTIDASLEKAATQTSRLVVRVFWRVAALLVLAFVRALLYRLAGRGWAHPGTRG